MENIALILIVTGWFLGGCGLMYHIISILEGHGAPAKWRRKKNVN